ncbi:hypothetical protein [Niabella ginsenosidivorans]|nr:hypothetical protein [Niabella ginsenosidivorans]
MNNKTNIRHWESAHNDWLRTLDFYKEEIGILNNRLKEIAGKNTGKEVGMQVEHFQNAFILPCDYIEEQEHAIHLNLAEIAGKSPRSRDLYPIRCCYRPFRIAGTRLRRFNVSKV